MNFEIENDRLVGVDFVRTSKMSGEIEPEVIIMHYTSGYTLEGDVNTLSKTAAQGGRDNASAHMCIGQDGRMVQIVPFNRKAWHAGPSELIIDGRTFSMLNSSSIGIEQTNCGYLEPVSSSGGRNLYKDWAGNYIWGDGTFKNGRRKLRSAPDEWLVTDYVHPVIGKKNLVWEPYYDEQLEALDGVVAALLRTYPTIKYIATHEQIDTRGWKSDPGPAFPMSRYTRLTESLADDGDEPIAEAV